MAKQVTSKRIMGAVAVLVALAYAAYSGFSDGREHATTAESGSRND